MFYNMIANTLRALGDSRTPLYFLVFSSLLNIILDLVFILVFDGAWRERMGHDPFAAFRDDPLLCIFIAQLPGDAGRGLVLEMGWSSILDVVQAWVPDGISAFDHEYRPDGDASGRQLARTTAATAIPQRTR
jgi:hypothetical protein